MRALKEEVRLLRRELKDFCCGLEGFRWDAFLSRRSNSGGLAWRQAPRQGARPNVIGGVWESGSRSAWAVQGQQGKGTVHPMWGAKKKC